MEEVRKDGQNPIEEDVEQKEKADQEEEKNQETETFPEEFQTVKGLEVYPVGDCEQEIVLLKQRGCLVWCDEDKFSAKEASELFDHIFDAGVLEDENGNENQSLVLPLDAFGPVAGKSGVVVTSNLTAFTKGLISYRECLDKGIGQASLLRMLASFVETIEHLENKKYYLTKWDGHQLYFNAEYESFRFLIDGIDLADEEAWKESENPICVTNAIVEAILFYALTGAWPKNVENLFTEVLQFTKNTYLTFEEENSEPVGEKEAVAAWNALPEELRQKFMGVYSADKSGTIPLKEWATLLREVAERTETCLYCGKEVLKKSNVCIFCGEKLTKENLRVRFSIQNRYQQLPLILVFYRGINLYGGNISPAMEAKPFTRVLYNRSDNALGIKNLSTYSWDVTMGDENQQILPGEILVLEKNLEIRVAGFPDVTIVFEDYEK